MIVLDTWHLGHLPALLSLPSLQSPRSPLPLYPWRHLHRPFTQLAWTSHSMHLSPSRVKWQTNKSTIYTVAKRQMGPFSLLSAIITIVTFIVVTIIIIIIIIITITYDYHDSYNSF